MTLHTRSPEDGLHRGPFRRPQRTATHGQQTPRDQTPDRPTQTGWVPAAKSAMVASFMTSPKKNPPKLRPTFLAILSDIHANIDALEAVLKDLREFPCTELFCLGDIVGYGPEPADCVAHMQDRSSLTVLGNHEAMLFFPPDGMRDILSAPLALARQQASPAQLRWLKSLPLRAEAAPLTLCHSSLGDPAAFPYIESEEEAAENFAAQATFVSFHGHSHVPVVWEETGSTVTGYEPMENLVRLNPRRRYAINVGSVGQPRDGDPRSSYVLYDPRNRLLLHRRVEYDIARAQSRIKKAGLPDFNGDRLALGQ